MTAWTYTPPLAPRKDPEKEFLHCHPSAREGIEFIRSLPDEVLAVVSRHQEGATQDLLDARVGPNTNPRWTYCEVVSEMEARGLISDEDSWDLVKHI